MICVPPRLGIPSLLLGAALALSCGGGDDAPPPELVRPVRAMQVPDPAPETLPVFTGQARAAKRSNLSFEVGGRILERRVDVGERVEEGQLLALLDPRDFEQSLRSAQAQAKEARAFRNRVAKAHAAGAISDQELTNAESRLQSAEATLRIRLKDLEDSKLVAPHPGEISAVFAESFQVVQPKQLVVRLLDTTRIEMVIDLPENRIGLARYVKKVEVRFDAFPELSIAAQISEIGEEASATTRTYPVTLIMDQPGDVQIRAGLTGRARARPELPEGRESPPILLPASAFATDSEGSYVWILDAAKKQATRREVKVADETARGVPVEDGLRAGEWVAISGVRSLTEGKAVEILDVNASEYRLPMPDTRTIAAGDATVSPLEQ